MESVNVTMLAKVKERSGSLVANIEWHVPTINGRLIDRFVDQEGNIYFQCEHVESWDSAQLFSQLVTKAEQLYRKQNLTIETARG